MATFILNPESSEFPQALHHVIPVPSCLYGQGNRELLTTLSLSVVGSRTMSPYAHAVLTLLIRPLVRAGLTIVSGLAYGVDVMAHRLALAEQGNCVAVLGSALDRVYPTIHRTIFEEIAEKGCVLSEYPPGTTAKPFHFPARNRIVAALSPVLLIVEAGEKSGTLSTAKHAQDLGRTVCVVPGDITREQSKGVNNLLKQGATPITSVTDILELYQMPNTLVMSAPLRPALTGSPSFLYDLVSQGVNTTERLVQATGWQISRVQSTLTILEIDGYIFSKQQQWLKTS